MPSPRTLSAMLSTTFLGHQGWLFQSKETAFLVDPLLRESFGDAQALGYRVFPPRVMKHAELAPLDAVVLTHEHDDHFDIPSLALLDRKIPIYLSERSSRAARAILGTMGFTVRPLQPGVPVEIGDLRLVPFVGDHVTMNCGDEWDALPFLVREASGSSTFFSMVDLTLSQAHVDWAKRHAPRPGLLGWTNNALDWSHMTDYLVERADATQDCFVKLGVGHKLITTAWGPPSATLMCAGGFTFEGDRAWMNAHVFCVDNEAVMEAMRGVYKREQFHATRPGQTFVLEGNQLKKVKDEAPFLACAPRESWPHRGHDRAAPVEDYAPATGARQLTAAQRDALPAALQRLAEALFGGACFRGLASLLSDEAKGRRTTFALVLRDGDERLVWEYRPTECAFVPGEAAAETTTVAGLTCWASDLLAVLDGDLGPIALTFGRARLWNALPRRFNFDLFGDLYRISHPLRRPDAALRTYERLWRAAADTTPILRAR